jgi:hypothetical protein
VTKGESFSQSAAARGGVVEHDPGVVAHLGDALEAPRGGDGCLGVAQVLGLGDEPAAQHGVEKVRDGESGGVHA